ncbi:hypothetical protein BpHYR1_005957 [Brachionus plicatilis]|uniref:Uncharacterized protein n=1 Tax=Brachionus plicatilis TaxID=10195 RepID=A0A3M7PBF3_BRAPC|nr:hypothetical protein BpHYR1_005957 [Brachionus plicatilis]
MIRKLFFLNFNILAKCAIIIKNISRKKTLVQCMVYILAGSIEQQRQVEILAEIGLNQPKPAYCLDLGKVNGCVRRIRIDGV